MIRQAFGPLAICLCLSYGCSDTTTDTKTETPAPKTAESANPAALAQTPTSAPGFAEAAAVGDLYEVESSRLATTKASSPEVRRFAEMMIADPTATTEQLKQIVSTATPALHCQCSPMRVGKCC